MPKYILLCASTYVSEVLISISQSRIPPDSFVDFSFFSILQVCVFRQLSISQSFEKDKKLLEKS